MSRPHEAYDLVGETEMNAQTNTQCNIRKEQIGEKERAKGDRGTGHVREGESWQLC